MGMLLPEEDHPSLMQHAASREQTQIISETDSSDKKLTDRKHEETWKFPQVKKKELTLQMSNAKLEARVTRRVNTVEVEQVRTSMHSTS